MTGLWRLLHFVGFVAWLGGGLGVMVAGWVMERQDRAFWGGTADVLSACYRVLLGPGAILTVISGIILTLRMYGGPSMDRISPWLGTMQGAGLVGALVTLLGAMPAAARLARVEPTGATAAAFDAARRRVRIAGMLGGLFSTTALVAGALYRLG